MLQRSNIISPEEELQSFYQDLRAQHVTPAWISGGVSVEPKSKAVPYVWHWRDLRPQAMRAAQLVGTEQAERRGAGQPPCPAPEVVRRLLAAPTAHVDKPEPLTAASRYGRTMLTVQSVNRQGVTLRLHAGSGAETDEVIEAVRAMLAHLERERGVSLK